VLGKASAPTDYEFAIHPRGGGAAVHAGRLPDGSWGVYRAPVAGPVFVLQAPHVSEQTRRVVLPGGAPHASMSVQDRGSWLDVRVSVDRAWLSAPHRHFPVLLDPTITVQPDTQDASFAMGCNCVASVGSWLAIGTDPGGAWRAALQFDLSSIPAGTAV